MPPKRFVFRLQTVLNIKLKVEEEAKRKYGEMLQLEALEKRRLAQMEHERDSNAVLLKERLLSAGPAGLPLDELQRLDIWRKKLKKDIEQQKLRIIEVEAAVEVARLALIEAMKERKILEALKEQQLEAFNKEIDEEEAKMLDELATLKYARGRDEE